MVPDQYIVGENHLKLSWTYQKSWKYCFPNSITITPCVQFYLKALIKWLERSRGFKIDKNKPGLLKLIQGESPGPGDRLLCPSSRVHCTVNLFFFFFLRKICHTEIFFLVTKLDAPVIHNNHTHVLRNKKTIFFSDWLYPTFPYLQLNLLTGEWLSNDHGEKKNHNTI